MIEITQISNVLHVVFQGELTRQNHEKYASLIAKRLLNCEGCVIDLKDVSYMDTSGLGILVSSMRECHKQQRKFGVRCVSKDLRRLIQITKLDMLFPVEGTLEEIRAAWTRKPVKVKGLS